MIYDEYLYRKYVDKEETKKNKIERGNIYYIKLPEQHVKEHHCEYGVRPVVVVTSDVGCKTASVLMVCPMTTKCKDLTCNIDIGWTNKEGAKCQVLTNQVMTIPKSVLRYCKGKLDIDEMEKIDRGLRLTLGLN